MRSICYTLAILFPTLTFHIWYTTLVIKNASPLLHFHCTLLVQTFTTHFPNYLSTIHKACPKPLFSFCSSGHPLQLLSQGPLLLKDPKRGSGSTPSVMEGMARCLSGSWGST